MYRPNTVTFTVTISPQKARVNDFEHVIEEALRAYSGCNTSTHVRQKDDTTLEITVVQAPAYRDCNV